MENKKKKSIVRYFIKMVLLFFVFLFIQQLLSLFLIDNIENERYGSNALFEIFWAGLVLLLLLLYKNKYIFTQKRISFKKGFKYIVPEFAIATFFLSLAIVSIATSSMSINILSILNLLIFCFFIGIVEEFLCRGWLLNEFLERYSSNRKEIILSIVFSSFIFGIIHFLNLSGGSDFLSTCIQVVNAGISGVFLALVYYKTKNIWLVVFSHFYWDFSIMLSEHNQLVECYSPKTTDAMILSAIVSGIIISIGYLILCYWMYRKTDLYQGDNKDKKNYLIVIGVIIYIVGLFSKVMIADDNNVCPVYRYKNLDSNYTLIQRNFKSYRIDGYSNNGTYDFELRPDKNKEKIVLKDLVTDKTYTLSDKYEKYLLVENEKSFSIIIQTDDKKVLYGSFLKSEIKNDDIYFEKVKNNLKEYHTPEIKQIYVLNEKDKTYNYIVLDTNVNKMMLFDENQELFFVDFE